jgi:glutamate carboxypeptidase
MKAGIVMALAAAAAAGMDRLSVMLTSDEELGSPWSRGLIEALARRVSAVLVLEPASGESLKIARKGVVVLRLRFRGRAAHAGLEPERGLNATVEAAHAIVRAASLSDQEQGTTVTPTVVRGGDVPNAVPDEAHLVVDVRAWSKAELGRVEEALRSYVPAIDGVVVDVERVSSRPPLTSAQSDELFALAQRVGEDLGLAPLTGAKVGGGSDGCLTAAVGTSTLDGLGAVGAGAHTEDEHVVLDDLIPRTRLVAGLIEAIRDTLPPPGDVPGSEGRDVAAELARPDLSHSQRMERMA